MKKFLLRIVCIGIPLLAVLVLFEWSLRRIPNPYVFKDELIARKAGAIKTLVIGSSVADYGIFPAYLGDSAYSLAISGEWVKYNEASLMRFIDDMPRLKTILWGVCFQMLWKDDDYTGIFIGEGAGVLLSKAEQRIYRGISSGNRNPLYDIECIQNFPVSFEKWKKYYLLHQPTVRIDSLGFDYKCALSERKSGWKDWKGAVLTHSVTDVNDKVCRKVYRLNCERMLRVAKACRERGVRLCLVVPPVHELYYTHVGDEQLRLMYAAMDEVRRQCDNVVCMDYFRDTRFADDDFYDVNHLSDVGARKFTRILAEDLPRRLP